MKQSLNILDVDHKGMRETASKYAVLGRTHGFIGKWSESGNLKRFSDPEDVCVCVCVCACVFVSLCKS